MAYGSGNGHYGVHRPRWGQKDGSLLWTPLSIPNLAAYYDSDFGITKDGSNKVSAWADQSGNGRDLVQATSSLQPLWEDNQLNGHPIITFDGIDDYLLFTPLSRFLPYSLWIVFKIPPTGVDQKQILSGSAGYRGYFIDNAGNWLIKWTSSICTSAHPAGGTWVLGTLRRRVIGESNDDFFVNNSSDLATGVGSDTTFYYIKPGGHSSYVADTSIANIGVVFDVLSDADKANLHSYMNSRYSLW